MEIQLTTEQVLALAPDSSSAKAGKKLAEATHWKSLGMTSEALWGECLGSSLYQVKVDLSSFTSQCSCPSRKLPCKHSLGLLLLAARKDLQLAEAPEWVTSWLSKRQTSKVQKQERATKTATETPSASQLKAAEKRLANVKKGLDGLDTWLNDLIRQGLASVQTQPASFWEHQAARLRDAQASALDNRLRRLADIPNSSPAWSEKLLTELGKLALLTHTFRLEDQLEPEMREEIRQLIGWSITQEEVSARGETVQDTWLIVGQVLEETDRGKTQRTWLYGKQSQRVAQILQFSIAGKPFADTFLVGTSQEAELTFWPGVYPQRRAYMRARLGEIVDLKDRLPGQEKIEDFLSELASSLGRQPWQERSLCLLSNVVPVCDAEGKTWFVRDGEEHALPLTNKNNWLLLACSGGHPVDLAGEWDGEALLPLGVLIDDTFTKLL